MPVMDAKESEGALELLSEVVYDEETGEAPARAMKQLVFEGADGKRLSVPLTSSGMSTPCAVPCVFTAPKD